MESDFDRSTDAGSLDLPCLVSGFARLRDEAFPDLRFLDSGGLLEVRRKVRNVVAVRLELPKTEYLHLASVVIVADGLDDPVRQTTRRMSSAWKDYEKTLQSGLLFDAANREKAFHTKKDHHPWLEIVLDQPRDLSRLRIRNVEGDNSLRERGLQVQVRTADGATRTLYDGVAREREFVQAAEKFGNGESVTGRLPTPARRLANRAGPTLHPAQPALVKILTQVELHDQGALRRNSLDRVDLPPEQVGEFRSLVNRRWLFPRELEWTSHGVRRSFRFWSSEQRQAYLGFALEVIEALQELTPDVCFGFGSALSIVRDHDLIPHDDDLDVLIGFEPDQAGTHTEGKQLIRDCLQDKGFRVTGGMASYQWVTPSTGGTRLDVFLGVFEGDKIAWYPGRRGALTREMMFPPQTREFLGHQVQVPAQPETYLEQIYGSGWSTPDPNFQHSWRPQDYSDIAGSTG